MFGKIVVGFHDPNDPAKQHKEPEPLGAKLSTSETFILRTLDTVDWRREKELRKIVKVFEESKEPWLRLDSDHDSRERKVIRQEAQARGLRSLLDESKKLVLARTEADLADYRNEHEDASSEDGNDAAETEPPKPGKYRAACAT